MSLTKFGYGDSETWGGREPFPEDTLEEIKAAEIESDENLTLEAVYAYLLNSEFGDLDGDEYDLLDGLFKNMDGLIEKSVAYYSEVLAKKEEEDNENCKLDAQLNGAYF